MGVRRYRRHRRSDVSSRRLWRLRETLHLEPRRATTSPGDRIRQNSFSNSIASQTTFHTGLCFGGKSGGFLKRGGCHWKEEVRRWQDERTTATPRWKPRRRHPLRSRRRSRTRYSAAIAAIPPVQVHWTDAGAVAKPITPGDVELPSPPDSAAGLHRIRRVLLRRANLPTGCRLRKRKRPLTSDQEAIDIDITAPQDSI